MKKFIYFTVIAMLLTMILSSCSANNRSSVQDKTAAAGSTSSVQQSTQVNASVSTASPEITPTPKDDDKKSGSDAKPADIKSTSQPVVPGKSPYADMPVKKKRVPIVYYHAINDNIEGIQELFVSPKEFEKQMKYLKDNNFTPITFDELDKSGYYDKPIILTFDDGYEDNYTNAYPVLKKYDFKATIFLVGSFIGNSSILNKQEITEMKDLVDFQSHTMTHPNLTAISSEQAEYELSESKKLIEGITGRKVDVLCYPTGYYNQSIIDIAKKYYKYGTIMGGGVQLENVGNYEVRRIYVPRYMDINGFASVINVW